MATGVIRQNKRRFENLFFSGMAVLILATVFVGLARSYYLTGVCLLGFGLACLLVIVGLLAATDSLARHFAAGGSGVGARAFCAIQITDMLPRRPSYPPSSLTGDLATPPTTRRRY